MIKPIALGLRVAGILGNCALTMTAAPLAASGELCALLAHEVLEPLSKQVADTKDKLRAVTTA